jgi:hypothetical protein
MPTARRSARRSTATQPFSPSAEAARPQLKSRAATPRRSSSKKARTPSPAPARSRSPSPSPAAASPAPAPASAASYRAYRTYLSESEFADAPAASWVPSILGLPSTDLLSLAICAFIGGRYVYTNDAADGPSGLTQHATAIAAAWLTAFGGGLICHTMLTLATMSQAPDPSSYLRGAFASGTLGFQQTPARLAALVGFAASVPIGHPYDATSIDADLFNAMDCLNWAILVGWAASKLAVLSKDVPCPSPLVLLLIGFPAGYAYCSAGGIVRNLLFTAAFTPSITLPANLQPGVAVPMAFGFAAYAVIMQLVQGALSPKYKLDTLLGIPAVAYIFYLASTAGMGDWERPVPLPQLSLAPVIDSGGDVGAMFGEPVGHAPAALMLTPLLVYVTTGLRR